MVRIAAILDCYTVEPSGLGVPPYLSTYARAAFGALTHAYPDADVRYLTIDDVRWCRNGGRSFVDAPLTDPLTYSVTASREDALGILADAEVIVVIAGDAVPSVHLQARNGSPEEIEEVLAQAKGRLVLLGPLATQVPSQPELLHGRFDAIHTHTLESDHRCHRTNVRQVRAYPGTSLAARQQCTEPPSAEHFGTWKADVSYVFDQPMKQRVYPAGMMIPGLHSFFVTARGTWYRRLGSYSVQVVEPGVARSLFEDADLVVTGHEPRYIYGTRGTVAATAA